jgi:hypothetical protein
MTFPAGPLSIRYFPVAAAGSHARHERGLGHRRVLDTVLVCERVPEPEGPGRERGNLLIGNYIL